jgi:hypothetical protein
MASGLGLPAVGPTAIRDSDLVRGATCLAGAVSILAAATTDDGPERQEQGRLADSPVSHDDAVRLHVAAWAAISSVTIEIRLMQPRQRLDEYGSYHEIPAVKLRTGRLTLSRERLVRDDWANIAALVEDTNPVLHTATAAGVLRRYVDSWTTF